MAKVLNCGDLVPGCKAVLEGKDEARELRRAWREAAERPQQQGRPQIT